MPDVHRIAADMDSDAATSRAPREHGVVQWLSDPETTARWRAPGAVATALALAMALMVALAACGSSSKPAPTSAQVKKQTCQQVEAALSDGPDPEADPVGHAQAQILPLREIHTTDPPLHQAIDALAAAYRSFSSTDGSNAAKSAVSAASKTIEHLCPGIES